MDKATRFFESWDEALKEAKELRRTPCTTDITVTIHAGIGEVVTMEYNIKKLVVPPEDKDNDR